MLKLKLIRDMLYKIVQDIDSGNSSIEEDQYDEILKQIGFYSEANTKYSKYQACKYLNISRSTFDTYIREGKLPAGKKQQGFKELFWTLGDLRDFKQHNDK